MMVGSPRLLEPLIVLVLVNRVGVPQFRYVPDHELCARMVFELQISYFVQSCDEDMAESPMQPI